MKEARELIVITKTVRERNSGVRRGSNTKEELDTAKTDLSRQIASLRVLPDQKAVAILEQLFLKDDGTRGGPFHLCMSYLEVSAGLSYLEQLAKVAQEGSFRRAFKDTFADEVDKWRKFLQTARR